MKNMHSWIVLDPSLLGSIPKEELQDGTILVINSQKIPDSLKSEKKFKIGKVDAISIARECGLIRSGTEMVSTIMLGAWAKATELVSVDALKKAVKNKFGEGPLTDANIKSIELAYSQFEYVT
jgi:Pyruvate/2-oxoacid:ferredoxin oxidoreductase gamma subunit